MNNHRTIERDNSLHFQAPSPPYRVARLLAFVSALVLVFTSATQAQEVRRPTPAMGGGSGSTPTNKIHATVGQAAVGRTLSSSGSQGIGFWYRAKRGGTVVAVPASEGEIGTHVTIPVMLTSSTGLVTYGPRAFSIKLRYNPTILFYEGPFSVARIGEENVVTVTGTVRDSFGMLAELGFTVMLGNAERTDIIIDSVEWDGATSLVTERVNGSFQALGVCKAGDSVRLIKRQNPTAIAGVAPQPAVDNLDVDVLLGYDGPMSLHVIDVTGRTIATLVYENDAKAGLKKVRYNISEIASGSYYLVLQTPEQLHTSALVIRK